MYGKIGPELKYLYMAEPQITDMKKLIHILEIGKIKNLKLKALIEKI